MIRAVLRGAAGSAVLAAVLATTAVPASAHTALASASPAKGSAVAPPSQIVLTYTDPVRLPRVVVTDASRKQYQAGSAQAVDNKVTQAVNGKLPNGEYTVGWRVVASDGHPVEGTYTFTVRGSTGAAQPATPAPSRTAVAGTGDSGGSSGWLWIGLIALVLAAAAGTVAWLRRSSAQD
ncbi:MULTISPECIES: copper resistance CopC family protein [unclassified Actinomadura]|uniref:copper resistance CopC family protein n=1 Tax=unclassified Actinomadura TaxID=2626254 RepID=UPI001F1BFF30|nr:copper resistance CopC family protein [Actinomadura sp. K4S16]